MISFKALRISPFWLGAGMLLASHALWAVRGAAGEVAIWREVIVHGQDLAGQLAQPVTEMKQQLMNQGCSQFSVAYWSVDTATRLRVEVRCRDRMMDLPLDSGEPVERARHDSTAEGSPR